MERIPRHFLPSSTDNEPPRLFTTDSIVYTLSLIRFNPTVFPSFMQSDNYYVSPWLPGDLILACKSSFTAVWMLDSIIRGHTHARRRLGQHGPGKNYETAILRCMYKNQYHDSYPHNFLRRSIGNTVLSQMPIPLFEGQA